ncbi:MAG: DUF4445 domain-containing protein [Deltaproteobacteria bacterium]|nr:DUF4445 domain-containing protein [Deltaproteobacteria bacterium]
MKEGKCVIRILPEGKSIQADEGQLLIEALVGAGMILRFDCGGNGRCGKCQVRIPELSSESFSPPTDAECRMLGEKNLSDGYRLACQATVLNDLEVNIPESSLLSPEVSGKGPLLLPDDMVSTAPSRLESAHYGLAVDLGTTTIAVYICDLDSGKVAGSISVRNPQAMFGDDVMSRISAVADHSKNLARLQKVVVKAIEWSVASLCRSMRIDDPENIKTAVVVGNSTMIHIFVGEDPSPIGAFPYTPRFIEEKMFKAEEIGFSFNPSAEIFTLPLISGYLGSDIVAAALAAELGKCVAGAMLVDIGTNGEVMLLGENGLWATSCATGPAFEGAAIRHGMQAVSGAIDAVDIERKSGRATCSVIQPDGHTHKQPSGICGSGVISAVAELYRKGFLSSDGRFNTDSGSNSFRHDEDGLLEFDLVPAQSSQTGNPITITQKDIRAIQLAKGALITGMELLCAETGLTVPKQLMIAGAFGTFIDAKDANTVGMFPDLNKDSVRSVGNAAGAGAVLSLLDPSLRSTARELARSTTVLDLASTPDFEKTFIKALAFPV